MRGNRGHFSIHVLAAVCAGLLCVTLFTGCPGGTVQEDVVGADTPPSDGFIPGVDTDDDAAIEYGEIQLDLLAPMLNCGIPCPAGFQDAESLCGWHLGESFSFRVRARHTALGLEGVEGIARVKLYQHWPTGDGDILLKTLSNPEADGLFTFQVERSQLDLPDPADGTYWLRVEVTSEIKDLDGIPMTKEIIIPLDVDTQGPELKVITPSAGQKLSNTASIAFTAEEASHAAGIKELKVLIQRGQGNWDDLEVPLPVINSNAKATYVETLDLTEEDTQDTTIRVEATDCLGNISHADVDVRIIAIPRFVHPSAIQGVTAEDQIAVFGRIYATQGDGLTGDPSEPPLDLLVTSNLGAFVAWGDTTTTFAPPVLVAHQGGLLDARFQDMSGDGVPDLVLLSPDGVQEERVVTLWIQDTSSGTKPQGLRTFQLKEKRAVQLFANKLDVADVTGDSRADVLVISTEENESLHVLHHSGKTAGVPGDPPAYLGYPFEFTGVTGGVDIGHADTNGDGAVDIIVGREGASALTTFFNDGAGMFDIGVDSLIGFGNGTGKLKVTNLHSDDSVEDVIVFHEELQALIMVENTESGYFDFPGVPIGSDVETWGNAGTGSQISSKAVEYDLLPESGSMVVVGAEIGGFVRGYFDADDDLDLAVTTPGDKLVRIYKGVPSGNFEGMFRQERFLNGGDSPAAIAAGDFNGDGMDDIAVVNEGTDKITLLMSENGDYHATTEIPMPLDPTWDAGQLEPTHALVADFGQPLENGQTVPDGREDLLVITAPVSQTWYLATDDPQEDGATDIDTPLFLTYLGLGHPDGPRYNYMKSAVSYRMSDAVSGAEVGNFDGDYYPDVAISTPADPSDAASGGNFDILRGGLSPLVADPTNDGESLEFGRIAGRFWPLGGFIGPRTPSDIGVGLLNGDDELDDIVLIAPQVGDISDPSDFQWARAAAYLTRYNKTWNACEATYNQVSYECCQAQDPALPCGPSINDVCQDAEKGNCEGPFTFPDEVGYGPIKVIVDYISYDANLNGPDDVPDVLVLNEGSFNFSYFIGEQTNDSYTFQTDGDQPSMYAVGAGPVDMDVGDLDGDLIPDVVVALKSSLVIAYGQDDPIHHFQTAKPLEKGPDAADMAPTGVLMADVNLDGFMDIVTSSQSESRIWIYISAGDRDYLGPYSFDCGLDPVDVAVIDWSGTECPNLVVVNKGSKSISLLRNERCD